MGAFENVPMEPGVDLVAAGGPLEPGLVLDAYRHGVFPWFDAGDPVLWWSPDPRAILPLEGLHVSRRLRRTLRAQTFELRYDVAFSDVMRACAERRGDGTWIHRGMEQCYRALHARGNAHCVSVYLDERLVGGIYGVSFGGAFAAESKFHRVRDASKVALVALVEHLRAQGFILLDVQFQTPHLQQFGCVEIPRADYLERVRAAGSLPVTW